ncbi:rRNA processing/ribosome biogenesis-domain-containing protein [Massariosphaeria phaeospora]|uniref:Pre-rRNA-processing protein RIX1 n=1 Tax=Massariosphaeria phaeospora TaxID=100035 RepID=A0A7C8HZQ3_9PLEO|nr:rRNA processing/ribosome biogenesis-domain-containing protein [Massariosphaeria phaeospora]
MQVANMASTAAAELATLRALTFRLSSTPTAQLPQHVPAIAASLANCKSLLASTQTSASKSSSDASVAIHKYRTLLSTLLQDRTIQGRWSAVVLIKTTLEVGGWETLQKSLPWVRGLLSILAKPDPPTTKKLCLITLSRLYILTRDYPTLVREITTPTLPAFIQSCLQIATSSAPGNLLHTVLESFNRLLPRHPTIFRSYLKQLQQLLSQIVAPTPSNALVKEQSQATNFGITSAVSIAARQLYVQLSCCTPKGASSDEWERGLKSTVASAHRVADKVFRAVVEEWQSSSRTATTVNGQTLDAEVQELETDATGLPPWSGIYAGGERLVSLLRLVKAYSTMPTASVVNTNVGLITDLLTRMLSLTVPSINGTKSFQNTMKFNNQVSKDERENLWLIIPGVHAATIEILLALAMRCEANSSPLDGLFLDQLIWVFGSESNTALIRTACYLAIAQLLKRVGLSLPKSSIDPVASIIRACCEDILPSESVVTKPFPSEAKANGATPQQASTNADAFLNSSSNLKDHAANFGGLRQAAHGLLPVLFTSIRPQYLSDSLRARMDRTAILAQHKDAMLASILNPAPTKKFGKPAASILPLMARSFPEQHELEGLLRPRMPVIRLGTRESEADDDDDEVEEDRAEEIEEDDDRFVGEELDTLLETAEQSEQYAEDSAMADAAHEEPPSQTGDLDMALQIEIGASENPVADLANQGTGGNKRPPSENGLPSLTKRAKVDEEPASSTIPAPLPTSSIATTEKSAIAHTVAPALPAAPQSGPSFSEKRERGELEGDESDDEDIVPLVFGQDTDDESDM